MSKLNLEDYKHELERKRKQYPELTIILDVTGEEVDWLKQKKKGKE